MMKEENNEVMLGTEEKTKLENDIYKYTIYILDGKKYVDEISRDYFFDVLINSDIIRYNKTKYLSINNSQIKAIEEKYNSFPEEVVFLENNNKRFDVENINNIKHKK